jgi:hypothetical protein
MQSNHRLAEDPAPTAAPMVADQAARLQAAPIEAAPIEARLGEAGQIDHGSIEAALAAQGFAILRGAVAPADLACLREWLEGLLTLPDLRRKELSDTGGGWRTMEIWRPSERLPALAGLPSYRRLQTLSGRVLGGRAMLRFDHAILKPPLNQGTVAWHQDSAYWSRWQVFRRRLHWWIPMQDVAANQGCLEYLPGSHAAGPRPHVPLSANPAVLHLDLGVAPAGINCPLAAGDAVVHLPHTIHRTLPNETDRARLAYILQFATLPGLPRPAARKPSPAESG